MRFIKKLPKKAKYAYTDKYMHKHYKSKKKIYIIWYTNYGKTIASFDKNETL